MSAPTRRIQMETDGIALVAAFGFGVAVGFGLVYPALPESIRGWEPGLAGFSLGPVGGPLLVGVGLFLCFFLGIFLLNWLFLETE